MGNDEIEDALLRARDLCRQVLDGYPAAGMAEMALVDIDAALTLRAAEKTRP